MPVRRKSSGSGLTESEGLIFEGSLSDDEAEMLRESDASHTIEGRLTVIEKACALILDAAGLPSGCGSYIYDRNGGWQRGGWTPLAFSGWTSVPWPVAKQRGYAEDSKEGFAARMVKDIADIRSSLAKSDHAEVAMSMFYLGVKWAAFGVKERHGNKSGRRPPKNARNIELARAFQSRRKQNDRSPVAARISDTALMQSLGQECSPPLGRSAAIAAVRKGLEILSG